MLAKKILYLIIFILADIGLFVGFVACANLITGNNKNNLSHNLETTEITSIQTNIVESTTNTHKAIYEKSSSPYVNWIRKKVLDNRDK